MSKVKKTLTLVSMALAVVAFAAPAASQADELVSNSELLEPGSLVNLHSAGAQLHWVAWGATLHCNEVNVETEVVRTGRPWSEEGIELEPLQPPEFNGCNFPVSTTALGNIELDGGEGTAPGFKLGISSSGCVLEGTLSMGYTTGSSVVKAPYSPLLGNCGEWIYSSSFNLETPSSAPVEVIVP
jgi:hypothetical protein